MTALCRRDDHGGRAAAWRRWLAAWAIASCVAWGVRAGAADDLPVDEVSPEAAQSRMPAHWVDLGANFDTNAFQRTSGFVMVGELHGPGQQGPATPRPEGAAAPPAESPVLAALRTRGDALLARIAADCGLTEPQRRTLQLAIESDIRRVAADLDAERRKYQGVVANFHDPGFARINLEFSHALERCRRRLWNAFHADSLVMKVLPTALEPAQYARLTAATDARRTALWRGLVAATLVRCDFLLGLDQSQYDALETLLLETGSPLRAEAGAHPEINDSFVQRSVVWMALADADWQRLRAGMSKRQIAMLEQLVARGRSRRADLEGLGLVEKVSR